jgi:hypothetical protein
MQRIAELRARQLTFETAAWYAEFQIRNALTAKWKGGALSVRGVRAEGIAKSARVDQGR